MIHILIDALCAKYVRLIVSGGGRGRKGNRLKYFIINPVKIL